MPLNDGESVVMRFLRKENVRYDLNVLGLSDDVEQQIKKDIKTTAGVVLLTGPTGSGKTTTLYTFLNELNNDDVKIITLEDPVEYQMVRLFLHPLTTYCVAFLSSKRDEGKTAFDA